MITGSDKKRLHDVAHHWLEERRWPFYEQQTSKNAPMSARRGDNMLSNTLSETIFKTGASFYTCNQL